jgi:Pentapeptide repeats (8 copies)
MTTIFVAISYIATAAVGATMAILLHRPRSTTGERHRSEPASKDVLELKKLQLEVDELADGPRRASTLTRLTMATAVIGSMTTLAIAGGGWWIGASLQANTNSQHEADVYSQLLQRFESPSAAVRLGSVIGLGAYIKPGSERSEQTIALLLERLGTEDDPDVLHEIVRRLSAAGAIVIPQALDAQHRAYYRFADALGRYLGALACQSGSVMPDAELANSLASQGLASMTNAVSRRSDVPVPYGTETWMEAEITGQALPRSCGKRSYYSLAAAQSETMLLYDKVVGIGTILSEVIPDLSGSAKSKMLEKAIMTDVDWGERGTSIDLHGYDLATAYVAGDASKVIFDSAVFDSANLEDLMLSGASFRNASMKATLFNRDEILSNPLPNLSGANWWQADFLSNDLPLSASNPPMAPFGCDALAAALRAKYPAPNHPATCKR